MKTYQTSSSPSATFTMGYTNAIVVAVLARIETWFPPGSEGGDKGLLLPKPASGEASRMEQAVRVTLDRSSAEKPKYSEIWDLVNMKLKWEDEQTVSYFTEETGGDAVSSDAEMPKDGFKPAESAEKLYEGSIWYEGNLTAEQMAESEDPPKVKTDLKLVMDGKDGQKSINGELAPIVVTAFDSFDFGSGIDTTETSDGETLSTGDVIVWGKSLVSATIEIPEGISSSFIDPRFVQNVTPQRTLFLTEPDSQGYTKLVLEYQNQKVLDGILDSNATDLVVVRRSGQNILIESRDRPRQGADSTKSRVAISDLFETYLQYKMRGHQWITCMKVRWRFEAEVARGAAGWAGDASIIGEAGQFAYEEPVMEPDIHPVQFIEQ